MAGQIQKKRADVTSLIQAESEATREAVISKMTAAAASATQKIVALDNRGNFDANVTSDGGFFSLALNEDAIARTQVLCAGYREGANICAQALALDPICSTWSTAQRMELSALLKVAEGWAQVQAFIVRARTEMASDHFAQAVKTLTAAADALSGKVLRDVDKQLASDTDQLLASAAQRQRRHIRALRALAMKQGAESDLRKFGETAMLSVRKRQEAAIECAPASILDAVPRHGPHPYWNPTEAERRNLYAGD